MKRIVVTLLAVALLIFGLPISSGAVGSTPGDELSVDSPGATFATGFACGTAITTIAVLFGGLTGVFTFGAGAVISMGIGGAVAGAFCN